MGDNVYNDNTKHVTIQNDEHSLNSNELQTILSNELGEEIVNRNNELTIGIPDRKIFPNLEQHDNAGLKFDILSSKHDSSKNNWYFSTKLNKAFIQLDKPYIIDIQYLPKLQEQLYLRVMIVYTDDMDLSVLRCNNHLSKDNTKNEIEKQSIVRCSNNDVTYIGTPAGKNCEDRLALLIKLNNVQPNENYICKQSIQLTFVCQNSCIGRKQTALIFTLENRTQILGKKVVNVKVCSCPKREKQKEEQNFLSKRKAEDEFLCRKRLSTDLEEESISDTVEIPPMPSIKILENGSVQMEIVMPNIHIARKLLENAFDTIAGAVVDDEDDFKKYSKYLRELKNIVEKLPT